MGYILKYIIQVNVSWKLFHVRLSFLNKIADKQHLLSLALELSTFTILHKYIKEYVLLLTDYLVQTRETTAGYIWIQRKVFC